MSALQRLAPRMAGLILIALGFCISVMHAYLFGLLAGSAMLTRFCRWQ